jgi:multidrug efflux system membrane fusion protein
MNDVDPQASKQLAGAARPPQRRATRTSRAKSLLAVTLCLVLLAALAWYLPHRNAATASGAGPAAFARGGRATATVALAEAKLADIPVRLEALGTVTPLAVATVHPQVAGVVSEILYEEGQTVARGEPLAQIDPRPFQIALDQVNGQLARDEAELGSAKVTLDRDRALLAQHLIAQQNVDTQAATVSQLEGVVASDRAGVSAAQLNLSYSRITAPIAGRVGLRPVDVGNYVSTTTATGIATLTQLAPIDVLFTLPADSVVEIQQRLRAGAALPTTVLDRTRTNVLGQGTFLTLDNLIDAQTGTIRAKARFGNDDGALFPNQFVNVQLQVDVIHDAVTVPAAAIRHGPRGDYVYVVGDDQTAATRPVTLGPAADDAVSIASGLAAGEQVVTEGGDRLTEGARVRLPEPVQHTTDGAAPAPHRGQRRGPQRAPG